MSGIRDIKRRLSGIKNMRKITGAMHMVSSARLKGAQIRARNFGDFFEKALDIMVKIQAPLKHREGGPPLFIVIASDKGLAGDYNAGVLKLAELEINRFEKVDVITVGQKAERFFLSRGIKPLLRYHGMNKELTPEALGEISRRAVQEYKNHRCVYAVYTYFKNPAVQQARVVKLLPPEKSGSGQMREYIFEPSPEELMESVLEFYVRNSLYGFYIHSYASEQAFRVRAMENATQNADDLLEDLSLKFHQERKAIITREITEIVSGAENYLH
ncbi:MAG TPA: ATP synthase F1 subunit gamma [Thermoanaerobacterales bacterium]|nr:ATP synthase F1 subunit gamma [Thermoanaerobacterales bacterium]